MPLDGSKLDRALISAAVLTTRLALFSTRADAVFNEADHPRASDGKFGSGGGPSSPLSQDDKETLQDYKVGGVVNEWLRGGRDPSAGTKKGNEPVIKVMDRLTQTSKTKEPMTVYRGYANMTDLTKLTKGKGVIGDKAYTSVSRNEQIAKNHQEDGWLMRLDLPAGTPFFEFPEDWNDAEEEMILPRGMKFKITAYHPAERIIRAKLVEAAPSVKADDDNDVGWIGSYADAATFNEADHPRASDGKFGSGRAKSLDYKSLKRIGPQLGSNPGGRFATPEGKSFYVKQSKSNDHAKNEVTAARLYELAGSPVLRSEPVDMGSGKLGTATEWKDVKNIDRKSPVEVKEAQKDFATHVWLANWDSVGLDYDNQGKIGGKMTTLDVGGSLLFRAQGAPKGDAFGTSAKEWDSLRDPSNRQAHRIFGDMSPEALRESARRVAAVPDDAIRAVVEESGPGSSEQKKVLADLLIARKADISKRAGLDATRADDANWKESEHPRDADGKFASGSGASKKGLSDYKKTLKPGAKGTTLGLMKHMLLSGKFSKSDIFAAAHEEFGLPEEKNGYVNWAFNDLKKKGLNPPPMPKVSIVEEEPEAQDPGDKITDPDDLENFKLHPEPEKPLAVSGPPSAHKKALADYVLSKNIIGIADTKKLMTPILAMQSPGVTLMNQFNTSMNVLANTCVELGNDDREAINDSLVELTGALAAPDTEVTKSALAKLKPFGANSPNPAAQKYNTVLQNVLDIYDISGTPAGKTSTANEFAPAPEAPKADPAKEALKEATIKPPETAVEVQGLRDNIGALLKKDKPDFYFPVKNEFGGLVDNWDKIQPENQKAVAERLQALGDALATSDDADIVKNLKEIAPLTGGGLAKESANKILAALQSAYGAAPKPAAAPVYAPKTVVEKAVYEQAKILPHTKKDLVEWHEGATGAMLKSRMRRDTSKIPGDFFAKATSAYGSDKANGLQDAVDNVMTNYNHYVRQNILDSSERDIVDSYKGSGYHAINDPLVANKGKMTTPRQKKLQAAIMKSFVPADTPSYRGMNTTLKNLSGFDDPEHSVGRAFEHYNFASCSRSESTARNFGEKVMLKFTVPAGANGLLAHQDEREIVLPANGMFRIDKVEQYPTGYGGTAKHLIHCTYLGQKEAE